MSLVRYLLFCLAPCLWALLGILSPATAEQQNNSVSYPVTVELDAVFPRNETYGPVPVFPMVFAVQNLAAARPSTALYIDWVLIRLGEGRPASGSVRLDLANATSNPYFVNLWTGLLNGTESTGAYSLQWMFRYTNCTDGAVNWVITSKALWIPGNVEFTIEEGGPKPDLAADVDTCPAWNATIGITGMLPLNFPTITMNGGRDVCGILADTPPPANPCAARINNEVASSISAELTASACATYPPVLTAGCPPKPTETPTSSGSQGGLWGMPVNSFTGLLISMGPLLVGIMLMHLY